jgi:hypothetical protein
MKAELEKDLARLDRMFEEASNFDQRLQVLKIRVEVCRAMVYFAPEKEEDD